MQGWPAPPHARPNGHGSKSLPSPPTAQELWCKKCPPTAELMRAYRAQPRPPPAPASPAQSPAPCGPDATAVRDLARQADRVGALLQNDHQVRALWRGHQRCPVIMVLSL